MSRVRAAARQLSGFGGEYWCDRPGSQPGFGGEDRFDRSGSQPAFGGDDWGGSLGRLGFGGEEWGDRPGRQPGFKLALLAAFGGWTSRGGTRDGESCHGLSLMQVSAYHGIRQRRSKRGECPDSRPVNAPLIECHQ